MASTRATFKFREDEESVTIAEVALGVDASVLVQRVWDSYSLITVGWPDDSETSTAPSRHFTLIVKGPICCICRRGEGERSAEARCWRLWPVLLGLLRSAQREAVVCAHPRCGGSFSLFILIFFGFFSLI